MAEAQPTSKHLKINVDAVVRKMPDLIGPRKARRIGTLSAGALPLFLNESTLDQILEYSATETRKEIGGFLIGNVYQDETPYIHIEHFLPASDTNSKSGSVTFTHQTWEKLREQIESGYPDHKVMGWHHTHPGMGIFLSNYDRFIHHHFFDCPWQIAMVVDPCQQQFGIFQWRDKELINNGLIIVPSEAIRKRKKGSFVYG